MFNSRFEEIDRTGGNGGREAANERSAGLIFLNPFFIIYIRYAAVRMAAAGRTGGEEYAGYYRRYGSGSERTS